MTGQNFAILITLIFLPTCLWTQAKMEVTADEIIVRGESIQIPSQIDTLKLLPKSALNKFNSTTLNIREYAPGGITTFASRGTTPQQNSVYWNGFYINNPMLGLSDLSLHPLLLFDEVTITHSNNSSLLFTGKPGAAIELNNSESFEKDKNTTFSMSNQLDWNENQHHFLKFGQKINGTRVSLKILHQNHKNNYSFKDHNGQKTKANHAKFLQNAVLINSDHRINSSSNLKLAMWWQNTMRQIPPTLFQSQSESEQEDKHLRAMASYRKNFNKIVLKFRTAYLNDHLIYTDSLTQEYSTSIINDLQNVLSVRSLVFDIFPSQIELTYRWTKINSTAYTELITNNHWSLSGTVGSGELFDNFQTNVHWRATIDERGNSPLMGNVQFIHTSKNVGVFTLSAGTHFRIPTYNDLFWPTLGNSELVPEKGWNMDLKWKWLNTVEEVEHLSISGFLRETNSMIFWLSRNGVWGPENLSQVRAHGIEVRSHFSMESILNFPLHCKINYDYAISQLKKTRFEGDRGVGKQLPYQPKHSLHTHFFWEGEKWTISAGLKSVSRRYISADHSNSLSPFHLGNASVSYKFPLESMEIEGTLFSDNLLNQNYQSVNQRPMPLLTCGVNIIIKFIN